MYKKKRLLQLIFMVAFVSTCIPMAYAQNSVSVGSGNAINIGSVNKLDIMGNYSQTGTLVIELGGTTVANYGQLNISGSATLAGILDVSLINSFSPSLGNTFQIVNYASSSVNFNTINLPTLDSGLIWDTNTGTNSITLTVAQPAPGCIDNDGDGRSSLRGRH